MVMGVSLVVGVDSCLPDLLFLLNEMTRSSFALFEKKKLKTVSPMLPMSPALGNARLWQPKQVNFVILMRCSTI